MTQRRMTRQQIVIEAVRLIEVDGFQNFSLGKLAKSLNVKPPSLYNHINNLSELQNDIAIHYYELLLQNISTVRAQGVDDVRHRLAMRYFTFIEQNWGLHSATYMPYEQKSETLLQLEREVVSALYAAFADSKKEEKDLTHFIRGLRSLLEGLVVIGQKDGFQLDFDFQETVAYSVKIYIHGFLKIE
ncbi:MAG: TetR/AcrR family transcriptional regulator [Bacilli bacterium]